MEHPERELIEQCLPTNFELRRLYNQHNEYERKVEKLARQVYLSPAEQLELKRLKRLKLRGKERMLQVASTYKAEAA